MDLSDPEQMKFTFSSSAEEKELDKLRKQNGRLNRLFFKQYHEDYPEVDTPDLEETIEGKIRAYRDQIATLKTALAPFH